MTVVKVNIVVPTNLQGIGVLMTLELYTRRVCISVYRSFINRLFVL